MLHGDIRVNDISVGSWEAERVRVLTMSTWALYTCRVEYRDERGYLHTLEFDTIHRISDEALGLASAVLAKAHIKIKRKVAGYQS